MKIAIIGSGISGLTCAYLLSQKYEVEVFEAASCIGGHTHTAQVEVASGQYAIDTGFIVFNDWTYPHFIRLMTQIGVRWKDSSMSFSVKVEDKNLEYNGTTLNTLFAQRRNFFRPSFYRMIKDILRFNEESPEVLDMGTEETLGEYLSVRGYSKEFKEHYVVPMGSAIWSSSVEQMDQFPIEYFVRFFKNHGMLSVDQRPVWKVIQGGSSSYLAPLTAAFRDHIHLNAKVIDVVRSGEEVTVIYETQGFAQEKKFDQVIFATHSNQVLSVLKDASQRETEILQNFTYQANDTILHTDESVLPARKKAWAAWNYWVPKKPQQKVSVTYNMNILQGIQSPETFCVSLNMEKAINPKKILKKYIYHHPVYTQAAFESQKRWAEINGEKRTYFCGAYWGYGFHEDGVKSALKVCEALGVTL